MLSKNVPFTKMFNSKTMDKCFPDIVRLTLNAAKKFAEKRMRGFFRNFRQAENDFKIKFYIILFLILNFKGERVRRITNHFVMTFKIK